MSDASNTAVALVVTLALDILIVAGCVYAMDIPELTFTRAMGGIILVSLATRRERA